MSYGAQYIAISILSLILWKAFSVYIRERKDSVSLPPGPRPLPIIGNVLDLPLVDPGQRYMEMGLKYKSSLVHLTALGKHITVINSLEDAEELLDRRSEKYSDRPFFQTLELMGWEYNVALRGYGPRWRLHRRLMQQAFRQDAVEQNYHPVIVRKVIQMLEGLLNVPEDLIKHNKMLSISVPLAIMYGYDATSVDDPVVVTTEECLDLGTRLFLPGANYIDVFPFLRHIPAWFPGFTSKRIIEEVKHRTQEMIRLPLDFVKESLRQGTHKRAFVVDFFEKATTQDVPEEEEEAVINIAQTTYAGASDTTISATGSFFYQMTVNPDAQKKAQEEIDRVVGRKRLPNFEDRASLPYIEAIYREVLRTCPPGPLGLPHQVYKEDYYQGYFMPKGMQIFANIWAMTHDPVTYPDPDTFKPERFFDQSGKLNNDSRILSFGFGRRVCVGKYIASSQLWLMMACVLACFNIQKATDELGRDIEIKDDFDDRGFIRSKCPYNSSILPRISPEGLKELFISSKESL